jgi:hypothetical protein
MFELDVGRLQALQRPVVGIPHGKERLGRFLKSFCAAFADWRWETTNLHASDDMVILETSERGTWTKPWDLFGNILEPSGETFEAAGSCPRGCSAPEFSYHVGRDRMAPSISTNGQAGGQSETSVGGVSTSERPAYDSTEPSCGRGDEVLMMFESANFDEDVFTDPNEFDIGRRFW